MKLLTIFPLFAYFTISGAADHTNLRRTQSFPPLEEICEIVAASPKAKGLCHAYEEKKCVDEKEDPSTSCSMIHDTYERLTESVMPSDCPCINEFEAFANAFVTFDNCESCERCFYRYVPTNDYAWVSINISYDDEGTDYMKTVEATYDANGDSYCTYNIHRDEHGEGGGLIGDDEISPKEAHQCTLVLSSLVEKSGIRKCGSALL